MGAGLSFRAMPSNDSIWALIRKKRRPKFCCRLELFGVSAARSSFKRFAILWNACYSSFNLLRLWEKSIGFSFRLRYLSSQVKSFLEAQADRSLSYPFAAAGINIAKFLTSQLRRSPSSAELDDSSLLRFLVHVPLTKPFEELFCACFVLLEHVWVMYDATYMDFPIVMRIFTAYVGEIITRKKSSLEPILSHEPMLLDIVEAEKAKSTALGRR